MDHTYQAIEITRTGEFSDVRNSPATLKYEPGLVVADGDYVILHGRFSGFGLLLTGLWQTYCVSRTGFCRVLGVIQNEASRETSKSGLPCSAIRFVRERFMQCL